MRSWVAVLLIPVAGCMCSDAPLLGEQFSCGSNEECAPGFNCIRGVCTRGGAGDCGDPSTDVANCGGCGRSCPVPVHARARCADGQCGRFPCEPGAFDVDGDKTFGCETLCVGKECTDSGGNKVGLTSPPVPEAGPGWGAVSSGTSFGAAPQTSAGFTNSALVGQPTPLNVGAAAESTSASFRNIGGFAAAQH